ncbi:MAG: toxin-antitoxin system, antitoxin component, Xre family protein [Candidatus Sigynarchaeota archaeon]
MATLKDVEEAIRGFSRDEKRQLLSDLPKLINDLSPEDENLLKLAESAFAFWDNAEDSIYDDL